MQIIFLMTGLANVILAEKSISLTFLIEAGSYFIMMVLISGVCGLFIHTVRSKRSALWPIVKNEVIYWITIL